MEKFAIDVLQLIIVVKVGYSLIRWMISPKKRRKSISRKIMRLFTNRVHHHLDNALRKQRKVLHRNKEVVYPANVIPLRKTK